MNDNKIEQLTNQLTTGTPSAELQTLLTASEICRQRIGELRSSSGTQTVKSDIELLQAEATEIERRLEFPLQQAMDAYANVFKDISPISIVSSLPIFLRLRGKPYTLDDHFPMEPLFRTKMPLWFLLKTGRQVSKSTCLAASKVIQTAATPFFNSLFVAPLFEQTRRFSTNYVKPFIEDSPFYKQIVDYRCNQNVLERSFKNRSTMFFSYCLSDADRIRGISADRVDIDEVQDIDWSLIPIILETMSASKWAVVFCAGTPKTLDNTIEYLWGESSQAEWVTRCNACNHYNIACLSQDLWKMIGVETITCAKCERPINPRPSFHPNPAKRGTGFWLHSQPDKAEHRPGYHAPQVIFPMHFDNPRKWQILRSKMTGANSSRTAFINEVLGESSDVGTKLISQSDLISACKLYNKPNKIKEALINAEQYLDVAVGVDWGGSTSVYGTNRAALLLKPQDAQSYTALAIVGIKPDGRIDVLYTFRFDISNDHIEEARACLSAWNDVDRRRSRTLFCHDFGGAGSVRETLMIQLGLPLPLVFACQYVSAPQSGILEANAGAGRPYWSLDKARSLVFLCEAIKLGFVGFPEWESSKHLLNDFLALVEDTVERAGYSNLTRIVRKPGTPDDVAHAVNFAAMGLWKRYGYPNFKDILSIESILEKYKNSV